VNLARTVPAPDVVLLTNYIPPYRLPLLRVLDRQLGSFRVLQSMPMDPRRPWRVEHENLNVETQRTLTLIRTRTHPYGFRQEAYIHFPYDTLGRLFRLNPDVILSAEIGTRTAQTLLYRRLRPNSRVIIWAALSEHSEIQCGATREFLRRTLLPLADAILVNGASGARYVKRFGVRDEKVFVSPQATDHGRFCSLPLEKPHAVRRRLIYAGRLIELKALVPFLSVLSRWCAAHSTVGVEFWLVGDGPEKEKLKKTALPPNLELRFWGDVDYGELPAFYAKAGILVFPSLSDEWGLVVNEAMAAGLPVLGSVYSQAVEELVEDGVTGWTFRANRSDEMYAALDRAMTTAPEQLREMAASARRAVEHLTPEYAAGRVMNAIRFVCGENRRDVITEEKTPQVPA
jgi:glycosyltransferase involved in cell wall biosynthesis